MSQHKKALETIAKERSIVKNILLRLKNTKSKLVIIFSLSLGLSVGVMGFPAHNLLSKFKKVDLISSIFSKDDMMLPLG
jgi:hypothetical protein